ncbi:DTW domain-containing protein [Vibrio sp. S4M6]|uniref:tRNA-uridine aminocarboxypropyltransferase n=1 Tax=Vibrio sinus TaxID=2946865 RepID=UPI00202A1FB6|nr:DTW domain-containing protein [Vibrio sinus]MCL9783624.1 DTW domain-containing protein [Vibrio sinus]
MSRYCLTCGKAQKACICQWIQVLASDAELIILQHPSEQHKPLGTARILQLSLPNCQIIVGENFSNNERVNQLLLESDTLNCVLFPNEQSQLVSHCLTTPSQQKTCIFLIDGTWRKAYKIWQLSTNLQTLPSIHLPEELRGQYLIRKAPTQNSVSTVEAGYCILSMLEPDKDFTPLLNTFQRMIEYQIKQMPEGVFEKNYRS